MTHGEEGGLRVADPRSLGRVRVRDGDGGRVGMEVRISWNWVCYLRLGSSLVDGVSDAPVEESALFIVGVVLPFVDG